MEFVDMKRYLDDLVDRFKTATQEVEFPGGIRAAACNDSSILVYSGIEIMADVMNIKLHEVEVTLDGFNGYEQYFMYRGVRFNHFKREDSKE